MFEFEAFYLPFKSLFQNFASEMTIYNNLVYLIAFSSR